VDYWLKSNQGSKLKEPILQVFKEEFSFLLKQCWVWN